MKTIIRIVLYIVIWFVTFAILAGIHVSGGGDMSRIPSYFTIGSLIIPYFIIFKFKVFKKFTH